MNTDNYETQRYINPAIYQQTNAYKWWKSRKDHTELCMKHGIDIPTSAFSISFHLIEKIWHLENRTEKSKAALKP